MKRALSWLALAAVLSAWLFPIYWIVVSSVTPEAALFTSRPLIPLAVTATHYRALFAEHGFLTPIRNSLVVAGLTTLIAVPLATMGAYAFVRLPIRGASLVLALILSVSMFPQVSVLPALYLLLRTLGLINTYPGLVFPYLTLAAPVAVWLLTGFLRQLPWELEAAAMLDGASRARAFRDVIAPLAAPGIATAAILTFLYSWNEFLFALTFTLGPERYTVPVAVTLLRGRYQVPWGEVLAATVVASVPVAAVVLLFQRRIVAGLTAGATKG